MLNMKWSLKLGSIKGIKILVHWTFILLIGWVVFSEMGRGSDFTTIMLTIFFVFTIFFCVVLHELGHSLTARRYGIDTKRITLLPIGGVASLERMPENPKKELWIALAGPAVNVVIALILFVYLALTGTFTRIFENGLLEEGITNFDNFIFSLFVVNIILVVFNAIPAFPMDGGRVLRALLAMKMERVKATQVAANLGQLVAIGFAFLGVLYNPILIFIGLFVFFGAYSENMMVQHLEFLRGFKVKDAMITNFSTLSPNTPLQDALDKLISGSEQDFVVTENDEVKGIVTRKAIINTLKENHIDYSIGQIMTTKFDFFKVNEKLSKVYSETQKKQDAFFPVMDQDGKLAGIINKENINEFVMIQSALN
jgi:Zn-dependent protease